MVRYLENHNIDIHLGSERYAASPTALWMIRFLKSIDSIRLLLQHGGPVDHMDEDIRNVDKPRMTAILRATGGDRAPVRFETEENARKHLVSALADCQGGARSEGVE
ncbi:hypothetical protein BU26DRAFT_569049 [Trematosphaeria pertusa]|uniref:Uncharacterized protein n=1 Tax=Trematosphaeria pertusa TaxID=390896 RepID=A0A6A6I382_9PLEO|nr:uncharacterized protein BU26DRAFT_569049 [Trematosphaeria pertusa]KAF2244040.1 hypothetical protein BU26DRAFT_569049 [Trematosphaeria pertusa]